MRVVLTKVASSHREIRTDRVEGETERLPTVGRPFVMVGLPLDPKMDGRLVVTSKVQAVGWHRENLGCGPCCFTTLNSVYHLAVEKEN